MTDNPKGSLRAFLSRFSQPAQGWRIHQVANGLSLIAMWLARVIDYLTHCLWAALRSLRTVVKLFVIYPVAMLGIVALAIAGLESGKAPDEALARIVFEQFASSYKGAPDGRINVVSCNDPPVSIDQPPVICQSHSEVSIPIEAAIQTTVMSLRTYYIFAVLFAFAGMVLFGGVQPSFMHLKGRESVSGVAYAPASVMTPPDASVVKAPK